MLMKEIYIIPDRKCIAESLGLTEEYQALFEYNDFFLPSVLDDEKCLNDRKNFYMSLPRKRHKDLLHGAFFDVTVHSEDPLIRDVSELRVRQSMDIAEELGIRGVIFHTNRIPNFRTVSYENHWLDSNEIFWRKILSEYPNLEVLLENMFDEEPNLLAELAERFTDEPRFGVCFDYAHAQVFGKSHEIENWVEKLMPYVKHMHINDNDLKSDLHQAIGEGRIDWARYNKFMERWSVNCSVLIEVNGIEVQKKSLQFMKKKTVYPLEGEVKSGS